VLHTHPVVPADGTPSPDGPRGRTRTLVLTSLALAAVALLLDGTAGVVLALAVVTLGATGLLVLRARRAAGRPNLDGPAVPTPVRSAVDAGSVAPDDLTERLGRLYDDHVEQVNMALGEGRDDLVPALSDSYMDQSLRLITGGGRPSRSPVR
jgi:hypothetical protein